MFRLKRPDVFPADDLGLVKAAQRVYGLRQRPEKRLLKMAEPWRPYRSVAAWYLWRSLALGDAKNGKTAEPAAQEAAADSQPQRHDATTWRSIADSQPAGEPCTFTSSRRQHHVRPNLDLAGNDRGLRRSAAADCRIIIIGCGGGSGACRAPRCE